MIDDAIGELAPLVGTKAACTAVGRPRSTHYRRHRRGPVAGRPDSVAKPQPRALSEVERKEVLRVLHEPDHVDEVPTPVYATLGDDGISLASPATTYRILRTEGEVSQRRRQAIHPAHVKPELVAAEPNTVWSWDITKLLGPAKWTYYSPYVIIDISRGYVPGWMLAGAERARLAERLLADTIRQQGVMENQLTIHADRGSSMASKPVALLLADLGVTNSHFRPHVSNDNPYSESQLETMQCRPAFPQRFGSFEDAPAFYRSFFDWYDHDHRHCGIGYQTPADVHYLRAEAIQEQRLAVLDAAHRTHPERLVNKPLEPPQLPAAAWINPPPREDTATTQ